jgi:hypothetical protein
MNTITCPELGVWRAWLDNEEHPSGIEQHLEECPACQRAVADLRQDAALSATAIGVLRVTPVPSPAEIATARERLTWRRRVPAAVSATALVTSSTVRFAIGSLAAVLVVSAAVAFTPEGRTAAAAFLAQFRSRQIAAVEVSPQSQAQITRTLNTLSNLGTVQMPSRAPSSALSQSQSVTLAEASRTVGFPLQTPDLATLPPNVDKTPRVQVMPAGEMRFTFDKAKAQRYLQANNLPPVNMPDKFNGATLVVSMPATALLAYGTEDTHETIVVGQAGELVVDVQGQVTLDELRDFLLGLPGLPKDTVDQLKLIRNWRETLVVPVPTERINWQPATFKGNQGLLLNDNSGVYSAAIWHSGGQLYGVAGSVKANDLKRVADSLAVR